jgi:transposase
VPHACVNPRQAREFARASGRLAKTDRVDAEVLARMGRALELRPTPPQDPDRARLSDLVARREDLTATIRREKNRAGTTRDPWLAQEIAALLKVLQAHLKALETVIAALIETRERLAAAARRLRSVPGIGPVLAAVILARLPELGSLDAKKTAALAGLAPHACDKGIHRGKRRIWGGRADVRRALSLALAGGLRSPTGATVPPHIASRYDPTLKTFRHRLEAAGKPTKLAITACARKLLTILNAMFRDAKDYAKKAA